MMQGNNETQILAAYATIKSLADVKRPRSSLQLLQEFIKNVLAAESSYNFSTAEIMSKLKYHFGFQIPESVVRSTIRSMDGIMKQGDYYSLDINKFKNVADIDEMMRQASETNSEIIAELSEFIKRKAPGSIIEKGELARELVGVLVEDVEEDKQLYVQLINEFILENEKNETVNNCLKAIREGSILFMGLSYSIREVGSIKNRLNLYLGTEILFGLVGYNGEIWQQFAKDFFELVRQANKVKKKSICLYYFSEIKDEIDYYFNAAESIVEGKRVSILDKPAMKFITDGQKTAADVVVVKTNFYHKLKYEFGIEQAPEKDYLDEKLWEANFENLECAEEGDEKKELYLRLISHVNMLRKGMTIEKDGSELDTGHLIVTNTKMTLAESKQLSRSSGNGGFAVSLEKITNLLWFKLGRGFSNSTFPSNVNAALKARVVLSANIGLSASKEFKKIKEKFRSGEMNEEAVASAILALKDKPLFPEDINPEEIDEVLDFSPEVLSRYENRTKEVALANAEKDKIIESLKADNAEAIAEKEKRIRSDSEIIKQKDEENAELQKRLNVYQEKEKKIKKLWGLAWRIMVFVLLSIMIFVSEFIFRGYLFSTIGLALSIGGGILSAIKYIKELKEGTSPDDITQSDKDT